LNTLPECNKKASKDWSIWGEWQNRDARANPELPYPARTNARLDFFQEKSFLANA
jgi:hypothetical protein